MSNQNSFDESEESLPPSYSESQNSAPSSSNQDADVSRGYQTTSHTIFRPARRSATPTPNALPRETKRSVYDPTDPVLENYLVRRLMGHFIGGILADVELSADKPYTIVILPPFPRSAAFKYRRSNATSIGSEPNEDDKSWNPAFAEVQGLSSRYGEVLEIVHFDALTDGTMNFWSRDSVLRYFESRVRQGIRDVYFASEVKGNPSDEKEKQEESLEDDIDGGPLVTAEILDLEFRIEDSAGMGLYETKRRKGVVLCVREGSAE